MKNLLCALLMVFLITGCKKEAEPDVTTQFVGKYDNGVLLINGKGIGTPTEALVTHTVTRSSNSEIRVETEIKSVTSSMLSNTGKSVIRTSSTLKYGSQTDPKYSYFESDGGFVKASFWSVNKNTNLNMSIVQADGTKIESTVAVRN